MMFITNVCKALVFTVGEAFIIGSCIHNVSVLSQSSTVGYSVLNFIVMLLSLSNFCARWYHYTVLARIDHHQYVFGTWREWVSIFMAFSPILYITLYCIFFIKHILPFYWVPIVGLACGWAVCLVDFIYMGMKIKKTLTESNVENYYYSSI